MSDAMLTQLPDAIAKAVGPLFELLPLDQAMGDLVVSPTSGKATAEQLALVERIAEDAALLDHRDLASALFLYIDELDRSHVISQGIEDATGSYWHGIMHRREGDFSNSHYWFRSTGAHEAMALMGAGYDGHGFVDDAQKAHESGENLAAMVDLQRAEWVNLFVWCAQRG